MVGVGKGSYLIGTKTVMQTYLKLIILIGPVIVCLNRLRGNDHSFSAVHKQITAWLAFCAVTYTHTFTCMRMYSLVQPPWVCPERRGAPLGLS